MVSSRAQEYITRFSKGVQKKTALKKIVEYRDECKGLYHEAESKNPMNYKAAEDKREYLKDMFERIHALGEARDYLQNEVKKAPTKANNMRSAVAFVPEKENKSKTTNNKYYQRTESDLRKLGIDDEHMVKYILRFQELGLTNADNAYPCPCSEAAEEYQEKWINSMDANQHDEKYCDQAEIAVEALGGVMSYFNDLLDTLNTEAFDNKYVYVAGNDEYVVRHDYESESESTKNYSRGGEGIKYIGNNGEDDWEDFQRVWGRT